MDRNDAEREIDRIRDAINRVDEVIVRLLNQRAKYAIEIGEIKGVLGLPIYAPEREKEVLHHVENACDGPLDGKVTLASREREFHTYEARGACLTRIADDGTIAPAAAGGSIAFAPEICLPALMAMRERYGEHVFRRYGFVDAFNPTLDSATATPQGAVTPGVGWFDDDYLGIDQGPIIVMIENHRSGLMWDLLMSCREIRGGLAKLGFTSGHYAA